MASATQTDTEDDYLAASRQAWVPISGSNARAGRIDFNLLAMHKNNTQVTTYETCRAPLYDR